MKIAYLVVIVLMVCACSAISVRPGAELVRVTNREPGRECKFLGDVTGSQGNRFTGGFTSDANLETGARNDLKNQAFQPGCWFERFWRIPSPMLTRLFFSSMTAMAMPFT